MAQLAALNTKKDHNTRFDEKFSLTRKLYDKSLDRDATLNLYKFLDWVLTLPAVLELRYNDCIHQIEEERAVAYITNVERIGIKKGYEQGMQKGIQQGIEYERTLLNRQLTRRFGHLSSKDLLKLEQADAETMLTWGEKIFDAKTIEDIFAE